MIIAGIDYSYTSPAICIYDTTKEFTFENLVFLNKNDKKKLCPDNGVGIYGATGNIRLSLIQEYTTPEERYRNLCYWASTILFGYDVEEVCIEGYSFGASSGLVFNIAENASLIKQYMDTKKIKFSTPTPSQVKKNFTGKGNAKKDAMVDRFHECFPHIKIHDLLGVKPMAKPIDDIVDSLAVLLCHDHFKKD